MEKFNHLMLDIETMGNESFSSIVSIGALEFNIVTGETGSEFYVNIDLQSCIDLGLIINASTVMWWMQQSEQARSKLVTSKTAIKEALRQFSDFCNKDYQVWGNSARFDCGILQNAYNKAGIPIPWDFRKERCVRTLVSFAPEIKQSYPTPRVAHDALQDCYYQAGYCYEIWKSLGR